MYNYFKYLLSDFMQRRNHGFVIPVYQRNYDWKVEHCQRLFKDVMNIHEKDLNEYFMGIFITVSDSQEKSLIIDGQQRLTTISLLLLAIRNLLIDDKIQAKNSEGLKEDIDESLRNRKKSSIKLKQVNQDAAAYEGLFNIRHYSEKLKTSNVYQNYSFFQKEIEKYLKKNSDKHAEIFYTALSKMKIVELELVKEHGDNPQLVFETINATGKKLDKVDLIRNFILMDKSAEEQEELFKPYWDCIEKNTRFVEKNKKIEVDHFIWHFLMFETGKSNRTIRKKHVYDEFKKYVNKEFKKYDDLKQFVEKIAHFSEYYKWFAYRATKDGEGFEPYFKDLRTIGQKDCHSYLMHLMAYWEKDKKNREQDVKEILRFITSHVARSSLCGEKGNYLQIFTNIVEKLNEKKGSYLEKFYKALAQFSYTHMIGDDKLKNALKENENFYGSGSSLKYCRWVLEKLVNERTKEKIQMKGITIEHVMPKKLNKGWKGIKNHSQYLNRLGNLTLAAKEYNSELGNRSFQDKKKYYKDSPINLNKYFIDIETWDEEAIQKRTQYLADEICKILPYTNLNPYRKS